MTNLFISFKFPVRRKEINSKEMPDLGTTDTSKKEKRKKKKNKSYL